MGNTHAEAPKQMDLNSSTFGSNLNIIKSHIRLLLEESLIVCSNMRHYHTCDDEKFTKAHQRFPECISKLHGVRKIFKTLPVEPLQRERVTIVST